MYSEYNNQSFDSVARQRVDLPQISLHVRYGYFCLYYGLYVATPELRCFRAAWAERRYTNVPMNACCQLPTKQFSCTDVVCLFTMHHERELKGRFVGLIRTEPTLILPHLELCWP